MILALKFSTRMRGQHGMDTSDPIAADPFVKLMEQVQAAVALGHRTHEPGRGSSEQAIAWCVLNELRRAGYVIEHAGTGFRYPSTPPAM